MPLRKWLIAATVKFDALSRRLGSFMEALLGEPLFLGYVIGFQMGLHNQTFTIHTTYFTNMQLMYFHYDMLKGVEAGLELRNMNSI